MLAAQLGREEAVRAADVEHVARVFGNRESLDRLPRQRARERAHASLVGAPAVLAEARAVELERLARAEVRVRARDEVPLLELEEELVAQRGLAAGEQPLLGDPRE